MLDHHSMAPTWLSAVALAACAAATCAQIPQECTTFGALVTPSWLDRCAQHLELAVIDLRETPEYEAAHIPGSISMPFGPVSAWSDMGEGDLLLEMPPSEDVFASLGAAGISNPDPATKIVLVYGVGVPAFPQSAGPRVATTLKYAGISEGRVAVLDGGQPGWEAAGLPVTTEVPTPEPASYTAEEDRSFLVDIDHVAANLHKQDEGIYLLDGRDAAVYNGSVIEEWALKPGHIPSAISLPAVEVWTEEGGYKPTEELERQVDDAVGEDLSRTEGQVIVYCGVGGYASTWYFILTRILGFENVVMYDGSAQEWSQYYDMEL